MIKLLPLLACCLSAALAVAGPDDSVKNTTGSNKSVSPDANLKFPKVLIPADMPSVDVIHGIRKDLTTFECVVLPQVEYIRGYYRGWRDCIYRTAEGGTKYGVVSHVYMRQFNSVFKYYLRGEKDGFRECAKRIKKMVENGLDDEEIKKRCRASSLRLLGYAKDNRWKERKKEKDRPNPIVRSPSSTTPQAGKPKSP